MDTLWQNDGSTLDVPRDNSLGRCDPKVPRNIPTLEKKVVSPVSMPYCLFAYNRQFKGLLDLFAASEWRVSLEEDTMEFSPLFKPKFHYI